MEYSFSFYIHNFLPTYSSIQNKMSDFTLTKQESIAQIFWSKNDVQKRVHCVAKNIPFVIETLS